MKELLLILLLPVLLVAACDKEKSDETRSHAPMHYTDLNDVTIKFGQQKSLNIDGELGIDLLFTTVLVADPIARVDKRRYYVNASFDVFNLVSRKEETPLLLSGQLITVGNAAGYNWYNASSLVLAEKILEEDGSSHWEGHWKNARHHFFAVQVRKNNLRYNGWVELSFKTDTEELVLHRAAIALEGNKDVEAGK